MMGFLRISQGGESLRFILQLEENLYLKGERDTPCLEFSVRARDVHKIQRSLENIGQNRGFLWKVLEAVCGGLVRLPPARG